PTLTWSAHHVDDAAGAWVDQRRLTIDVNILVVVVGNCLKRNRIRNTGANHDFAIEIDRIERIGCDVGAGHFRRINDSSGGRAARGTNHPANRGADWTTDQS